MSSVVLPFPVGAIAPAPSHAAPRWFYNVDRLRVLAMVDIVVFHARGQHVLAVGLPLFLLMVMIFAVRPSGEMSPLAPFLASRFRRLLVPWVAWSLAYAAAQVLARLAAGEPLTDDLARHWLIHGTYYHLWFLPFAFIASIAAALLRPLVLRYPRAVVLIATAVGLVTMGSSHVIGQVLSPTWCFALPSIPLGLALATLIYHPALAGWRRCGMLVPGLACAAVGVAIWSGSHQELARYSLALGLSLLVFCESGTPHRFTRQLLPLLYGIFLVHPMVLMVLRRVVPIDAFWSGWALAALALLFSPLLVWALRRTPLKVIT